MLLPEIQINHSYCDVSFNRENRQSFMLIVSEVRIAGPPLRLVHLKRAWAKVMTSAGGTGDTGLQHLFTDESPHLYTCRLVYGRGATY